MEHERFLSTAQVADLLGVHRTTVLRLVEEGRLVARVYRYSERATVRIPESAVAVFLQRWSDAIEPTDEPHGRRRSS